MGYQYKNSKKNVEAILNSKTEVSEELTIPNADNEFTYKNGIRTWVGAIFVDMRDSSTYFTENKPTTVAKVMRAYISEIIGILQDGDNFRDIGIRGDCVYGIYSAPKTADLEDLVSKAALINSFNSMFQSILKKKGFPTFSIGIGLGAGHDLVVKAGKRNAGINDFLWIGDAVINASNLSSFGDSEYGYSIFMDSTVRLNVKNHKLSDGSTLESALVREIREGEEVYKCNLVNSAFDKWAEGGYKD